MPRPADGADESEEVAWRREVALLERVISHLLAKDNVLVVADIPEVRILLHLELLHCCASVLSGSGDVAVWQGGVDTSEGKLGPLPMRGAGVGDGHVTHLVA